MRSNILLALLLVASTTAALLPQALELKGGPYLPIHKISKDILDSSMRIVRDTSVNGTLPPLVIVPGLGGNRIEAKLNNVQTPHFYCSSRSNWYSLWLSAVQLMPLSIDCFVFNTATMYDAATDMFINQRGVQTRLPGYGDMSSVEFLDLTLPDQTAYLHEYKNFFTARGYSSKNLLAAPYDWRLLSRSSMFGAGGPFDQLKQLIEHAYENNNHMPVILIGHSEGAPLASTFLSSYVDVDWKQRFVSDYISLGGPYGGIPGSAMYFFTGYSYGIPMVDPLKFRPLVQSMGGAAWALPSSNDEWGMRPIIGVGETNYTMRELATLLEGIGAATTVAFLENVLNITKSQPPGVRTHCLYATQRPTRTYMWWEKLELMRQGKQPQISYTLGDGVVPLESLQVCTQWGMQQSEEVVTVDMQDMEHATMAYLPEVFEYIYGVATSRMSNEGL